MARLSLTEFVSSENQKQLRLRLVDVAKKGRMSQISLATRLKINPSTLNRFLKQELDVDFRTLSIIEAFIEREEAKFEQH
jgi:hypothetical protein